MADSIDLDHDAPCDDEAPTHLQRIQRVQLHPSFDPRRLPTQRRLAVVRPFAAPASDPDLTPLDRRGGVGIGWVTTFIAAAYLSILAAIVLAMR